MKPLEGADAHHLNAAQGWLELGNHIEANEELQNISPAFRAHPDVREIMYQIFAKANQWEVCVDIGQALVDTVPKRPFGWIHRSFALHCLKRTQEAYDRLEAAADIFPAVWLIRYNLACYACQLGMREQAWEWLTDAFDLADDQKAVKLMALNDSDLEHIWTEIHEI